MHMYNSSGFPYGNAYRYNSVRYEFEVTNFEQRVLLAIIESHIIYSQDFDICVAHLSPCMSDGDRGLYCNAKMKNCQNHDFQKK